MDELKVFTGNAHPALAQSVCDYLGIPLGEIEVSEFSQREHLRSHPGECPPARCICCPAYLFSSQ